MQGVVHPVSPKGLAPPEYGLKAQSVRIIKVDLATARDHAHLNIGGAFVRVVEASSPFAYLTWFFNDHDLDGITLHRGAEIKGVRFARPLISHTAQPGHWVKLLYTTEAVEELEINTVGGRFEGMQNENSDLWYVQVERANLPANYSMLQIFNSGNNAIAVHDIRVLSDTSTNINLRWLNTAVGNLVTVGKYRHRDKAVDPPVSFQVREHTAGAVPGNTSDVFGLSHSTDQWADVAVLGFQLLPGEGFIAYADSVNENIHMAAVVCDPN